MGRLKIFIATLAGTGFLPVAPGSWGSLLTLLLLYPVALKTGNTGIAVAILTGSLLTLWTAEECENRWGRDPGRVLIDEFSGQAVVLLFLPLSGSPGADPILLAAAFLFFRLFDILKPFGIKQFQDFPSGFGILLDDLVAGLYALLSLHSVIWLISSL